MTGDKQTIAKPENTDKQQNVTKTKTIFAAPETGRDITKTKNVAGVIVPTAAAGGAVTVAVAETGGATAAARRQSAPTIGKFAMSQTEPTLGDIVFSGDLF